MLWSSRGGTDRACCSGARSGEGVRKISSEEQIVMALREQGFDAQIVGTRFEDECLVVLFTIAGSTGRRVALTAYITARQGVPAGALESRPRIDIYEGFIDREAIGADGMGLLQGSRA